MVFLTTNTWQRNRYNNEHSIFVLEVHIVTKMAGRSLTSDSSEVVRYRGSIWQLCFDPLPLSFVLYLPPYRNAVGLLDLDGLGQRESVRYDVAMWSLSPRVFIATLFCADLSNVDATDDLAIALLLLRLRIFQRVDSRFEVLQVFETSGF